MHILITGGAGFIASHVADAYLEAGHQVSIIDNLSTGKLAYVNPKAQFFQAEGKRKKAVAQDHDGEEETVVAGQAVHVLVDLQRVAAVEGEEIFCDIGDRDD